MKSITLGDIQALFHKVIIPFHEIERDMCLPLPDHRADNDAEHSWSLSLLGVALASEIDKTLDVGLIAIYAIVHDLVEVRAGDTSVWADKSHLKTKEQRESQALQKLKSELPQYGHLWAYIERYETNSDDEARFVYALDKFLNLLTIAEDGGYYYHTKHLITKERYEKQLSSHRQKAHLHPKVAEYYDQLRQEFDIHPEHFYQVTKDS